LENELDAINPAEPSASATVASSSKRPEMRPGIAPHAVPRPWRRRFRLPLKIADSYLLASVISGTFRGLCWFGGLLFAFAIISAVRRIVSDQLPASLMIKLVAYQMPRILLFTLPMSVLFGTVQTFADLSTRGELTALSVGGMSLPRMVRSPLVWGALLAVLAFWLQESVVPQAERRNKEIVASTVMSGQAGQEEFVLVDRTAGNQLERVIQANYFDPKTRTLLEPSIQLYNANKEVALDIRAERAHWDVENGKWIFSNGYTKIMPNVSGNELPLPRVSKFKELVVDVLPDPKAMKARTITINEHLEKKNYEMLSISDLRSYRAKQPALLEKVTYPKIKEKIQSRIKSLTFGIHDKIATPLICIAVILIGAPLGVRPQRSGGGFAMGLSLAALLLYYVLWSWVSQIGKAGIGNPVMLAYLPLCLTLLIGVVLMKIKSR
jgi:lipopolysaccharide export system permease protein